MKSILSILIALVSCLQSFAAWPDDSICRVRTIDNNATGFVAAADDHQSLIITTAHAFDRRFVPRAEVIWKNEKPLVCKVLVVDYPHDAAVLLAPTAKHTPLVLNDAKPNNGPFVGKGFAGSGAPETLALV